MAKMKWIRVLAAIACLAAGNPAAAAERLANGAFTEGLSGWWSVGATPVVAASGAACIDVPPGTTRPWSIMLGQNDLGLSAGTTYRLRFSIRASTAADFAAIVQTDAAPWPEIAAIRGTATPRTVAYLETFDIAEPMPGTQLVIQFGGATEAATVCISAVSLVALETMENSERPALRVNQLGYMRDGPKRATLASEQTDPVAVRLRSEAGEIVWQGMSQPRGHDASAGLDVHVVDFSAVRQEGRFALLTESGESLPFAIAGDLYQELPADAARYFHLARSGTPLDAEHVGASYARPAGHAVGPGTGAVNQGDAGLACAGCDYALDLRGGWYDAGDHGKYVVNGGLAVAQLLAAHARATRVGVPHSFADGGLAIPEAGNGIPDLLDEARWQLDFLLAMQVPQGRPLAGMAHHKVHDANWTFLPLLPSDDPESRVLFAPSTAATLNLAAAAAQGARLFAPHDAAYADRLLEASERAYRAAKANPDRLVSAATADEGGGAYDDDDVSDEFYWAAAELFITTGEAIYLEDARASPHWDGPVFVAPIFDWRSVAGFARLQLALNGASLPEGDAEAVVASVISGAEAVLAQQGGQPFGHPYAPSNGRYGWGSNHLVIQNGILLATAYDLTDRAKFRDGALEAIDYVMGRNALGRSYIVGYGRNAVQNLHGRGFAHSVDPRFPPPPVGTLAGGANSGLDDPVAMAALAGCAPQACHLDDVESWSTNEMAINWNAALVQFAGWLADQ